MIKISIANIRKTLIISSILTLSACGGDNIDSNVDPAQAPALSGKIVSSVKTTSGGQSITSRNANRSSLSRVLVTAVDASGNSYSTTTNTSGDFKIDNVENQQAYALLVVDPRSNLVIASLTTSSLENKAVEVKIEGATNLGEILVNPSTRTALLQNSNNKLKTSVTSLDSNADGIISSDEITAAQVGTIRQQGAQALTNISLVNYLGDINTWSLSSQENSYEDSLGNISINSAWKTIRLVSAETVEGPNGGIINAAREVSLNYYSVINALMVGPAESWLIDPLPFMDTGYISQAALDNNMAYCADSAAGNYTTLYADPDTLAQPPSTYDACYGLIVFAQYRYVDSDNNRVAYGRKGLQADGTMGVVWDGLSLPLNFEPGVPVVRTLNNPVSDMPPVSNNPVGEPAFPIYTVTETITIDFVTDAIITDSLGNDLPIIRVQIDTTDGIGVYSVAFYVNAKYGIQLPTVDGLNKTRSWDVAFAESSRFGIVNVDKNANTLSFTQTNPNLIGAQSAPGAMLAQAAGFDTTARDQWLDFVYANHNEFDVFTPPSIIPCATGTDPNNPGIVCEPQPPICVPNGTDINCQPPVEPCGPVVDPTIPCDPIPCLPIADPNNPGIPVCQPPEPQPPIPLDFSAWLDCFQSQCVTPPARDPASFLTLPLIAGDVAVAFETDIIRYHAKAKVQFYLEFRSMDANGFFLPLLGAATQAVLADATTVANSEASIVVTGTMNIPLMTDFALPGWQEPGGKAANDAELWLVMSLAEDLVETITDPSGNPSEVTTPAGTKVTEIPLDIYVVQAP